MSIQSNRFLQIEFAKPVHYGLEYSLMQHPPEKPAGTNAPAIPNQLQKGAHYSAASVQAQLAAMRGGIHEKTHTCAKAAAQPAEKRELSPSQIEVFIEHLKHNFEWNAEHFPALHPNVEWEQVEESLRARPDLMWSLFKMADTGGIVDVIGENADKFLFGDTAMESPAERRNTAFDREAEERLRQRSPDEQFNGNAADLVEAWGVEFMSEAQYRALQKIISLDVNTMSFLKTPYLVREAGDALSGDCSGGHVLVRRVTVHSHQKIRGFRCVVSVPKVKVYEKSA